jgi:uncharacterized protein (TIGR01777 family)
MRTIITGGTGLIGRALADSLAADGQDVILLSRTPERAMVLPAGGRAERWDGCTAAGWGVLADGADAVVNLAGESIGGENMLALVAKRWTPERLRLIRNSRVNAGTAVRQAIEAARQKPRVLIQASAVGYYGLCRDQEVTEDTPPGDDLLSQICLDWEAATADVEKMGVRRAVIRTAGVVMSTKGGAFPFMALPFKFFCRRAAGQRQAVVFLDSHRRRGARDSVPDGPSRGPRRIQRVRAPSADERRV